MKSDSIKDPLVSFETRSLSLAAAACVYCKPYAMTVRKMKGILWVSEV